jgi:hypothetical protein
MSSASAVGMATSTTTRSGSDRVRRPVGRTRAGTLPFRIMVAWQQCH